MCGISGYICFVGNAIHKVIESLSRLQNRGYDSAGVGYIFDNELIIEKYISDNNNAIHYLEISDISKKNTNIAIGHTRWATHGSQIIENAHPHIDFFKRFSIVHNGIIENYDLLREELLDNGYNFYGKTDSEILVNYIHYYHQQGKNFSDLVKILHGTWAILLLDILHPDKIWFLKNGLPLIIGFDEEKTQAMFVSEISGFSNDIKKYFTVQDNTHGYLEFDQNNKKINIISNQPYELQNIKSVYFETTCHPFNHWTLKEIYEQPKYILQLLDNRIDSFSRKIIFPEFEKTENMCVINSDHIIFLACGTSYFAAQYGAKYIKEFCLNITYEVIDGADFEQYDIPNLGEKRIIALLLSQSGETRDLYRCLRICKSQNIKTIGIINVEDSLISREVDICLYTKAGKEMAVASTKSFTNQVIMILMLMMFISQKKNTITKEKYLEYINSLEKLSKDYANITDIFSSKIEKSVNIFDNSESCFILGKHKSEWIAKEGALKIKEISYIHAEGFSAPSLKHGPFALLTDKTPTIVIANNDEFYSKIENIINEIKSRNAKIILITNNNKKNINVDELFYYDSTSLLFTLMCVVPLQLFAYYLSIKLNHNPDYPRNLAKVVTVD